MKNMPMFTTDNGIASLTLSQIPYTARAYVRIQKASEPDGLLEECISFCRAVGAGSIFAAGHATLQKYPVHTQIVTMCCPRRQLIGSEAVAVPLTREGINEFRDIYNKKMKGVANAAYLSDSDAEELLDRGGGYTVVKNGHQIGIGIARGDKVEMLASLVQGCGWDVLSALAAVLTVETVTVEVATVNPKAYDLYLRSGFLESEVLSQWYKVF